MAITENPQKPTQQNPNQPKPKDAYIPANETPEQRKAREQREAPQQK